VTPSLWYGPRPVRGWSGRHALRRAALVPAALAAALVAVAGGAGAADGLREQVQTLQQQRAALERSEHGALLSLYAAESSLARARGELSRLERLRTALDREQATIRSQTAVARRSLAASQARVARTLRALYIAGDADPLAVVLGAASLDEILTGIDSLRRATAQNQRLASEARSRALELSLLQADLVAQRAAATRARDAALAAADRFARAAAERRATLGEIRARAGITAGRLGALEEQARAASRRSAEITRATTPAAAPSPSRGPDPAPAPVGPEPVAEGADAVATDEGDAATTEAGSPEAGPATTDPATEIGSLVPPPGQSRTVVVDAVAYHLPGRTASGLPVGPGIVAVDPRVIPLGTRLFIPGYGPGIAADTGSAVKGLLIDLWMPSTAEARRWGLRTVTITIYG